MFRWKSCLESMVAALQRRSAQRRIRGEHTEHTLSARLKWEVTLLSGQDCLPPKKTVLRVQVTFNLVNHVKLLPELIDTFNINTTPYFYFKS